MWHSKILPAVFKTLFDRNMTRTCRAKVFRFGTVSQLRVVSYNVLIIKLIKTVYIKTKESSAELSLQMSPDIYVTGFENHLQRMLMSNKYQVCTLFFLVSWRKTRKRGAYVSRDKRSKISTTLGMSTCSWYLTCFSVDVKRGQHQRHTF